MTDYEFQCLLKQKKLLDSLQFYSTCVFQLASAEISYKALVNLLDDFKKLNDNQRETMFKMLSEEKHASLSNPIGTVNFFSQSISLPMAIDKLTDEIMSLLHNFYDVYAQWINAVLFGEEALPLEKVSLLKIIQKLLKYPEYTGDFITDLLKVTSCDKFKYIADYNNISKHRYHVGSALSYNIFDGESKSYFSVFEKDTRSYPSKDLLETIKDGMDYCNQILHNSRQYVENYYQTADNLYVVHRCYNPVTYLQYESEEDIKNSQDYMHMYYIEVDPKNILEEYHIMLINDDMEQINVYNSVYPVIALKDKNVNGASFIGCLIPEDSDTYELNDYHNLRYRKYITKIQDFMPTIYKEMANRNFKIYPYLSKIDRVCRIDAN